MSSPHETSAMGVEAAYQVLLARSLPFLPVGRIFVLSLLPLRNLLFPLFHIKVYGAHALHALVLRQVCRVPPIGPRKCARLRVELGGEVVRAAGRGRPREGGIEVREGRVDALRHGGLLQGVNLRDGGGYRRRTGGRPRRVDPFLGVCICRHGGGWRGRRRGGGGSGGGGGGGRG